MYTPSYYKVEDQALLHEFMRNYSFATLVSFLPTAQVTHLPFVVRTEPRLSLVSHTARANPIWRSFADTNEVLVIFQGPHAYVSPSLYESNLSVPTWNYAAVHAYGQARIRTDVDSVLEEMVKFYDEAYLKQWMGLPVEYRESMKKRIVAFEVTVERLEGKFKMSQNRSVADQENIVSEFANSQRENLEGVAEIMKRNLAGHKP